MNYRMTIPVQIYKMIALKLSDKLLACEKFAYTYISAT